MDLLTKSADFTPTRKAALARLDAFLPSTGRHYSNRRNFDFGPQDRSNISALSPHIRHRLISEQEVIQKVLTAFAASTAEKFIQEVFWRTYWKGWLEMRPIVWCNYCQERDDELAKMEREPELAARYQSAVTGQTGIEGFDDWALELLETGYLHNHARMWFASIWIFTLKLPWSLGADFFYRNLLDGDPASNTLSWRWVGGLQTKGKTYLARQSNIKQFTGGRFSPRGLATFAEPLIDRFDASHIKPQMPNLPPKSKPDLPAFLLVTEEDCSPEMVVDHNFLGACGLLVTDARSPLEIGGPVKEFAQLAVADSLSRIGKGNVIFEGASAIDEIVTLAQSSGAKQIMTAYPPVGPVADCMKLIAEKLVPTGIVLNFYVRSWDRAAWPYATKGFFPFKENIPSLLENLPKT